MDATMADGKVYSKGWHPDEIGWASFDASKVEPWLLTAIKAAAFVEFNAPDYVIYLKRVFKDSGPEMLAATEDSGPGAQHPPVGLVTAPIRRRLRTRS